MRVVPALLFLGSLGLSQSIAPALPARAATEAKPIDCVTPRATVDRHRHTLRRVWIDVFTRPAPGASRLSFKIASPLPLWVLAKSGAFLQVATGDTLNDWPFKPHATLGWVRASDVEGQAIRNCT